ncbi:hypothetical protein EDB83DRAFT_2324567 [Lactarius deliciosus]|nr:hypothetical protein EDB83DRAFT_2324567 [Lactarius deliciosus]
MPKKKLGKQSRRCNVRKALDRRVQKVEESKPENRTRLGTRLPSENSEATEIEEVDKPECPDIVELSADEFFSLEPQNAPRQAPAPEESRKRVHASHHNGKSERTIRRHKKAKKDLEAQGFFSLQEFFKRMAESARQEEPAEAVQSEDTAAEENEAHEEDKGTANEDVHRAKVTESVCNIDGGAASANMLEAGDKANSADEDDTMGSLRSAKGSTTTIWLKEEEEEETDAEDEAKNLKTTGGTMSMHGLSGDDLSDSEQLVSHWGPSRTVLYESEESSSSSSSDQSDVEDLDDTDTKELEAIHHGNAPDDDATQQPVLNAGHARGAIPQDPKHKS